MKNNKGMILPVAMGFMVFFSAFGLGAIQLSQMQGQSAAQQLSSTQAFWLAEAALQRSSANSCQETSGSLGTGSYSVSRTGTSSPFTLTSTGTVSNWNRKLQATCTVGSSIFSHVLTAKETINLDGSPGLVTINSYNNTGSSKGNASIATNSAITDTTGVVTSGNVTLNGQGVLPNGDPWSPTSAYAVGDYVTYNGSKYQCVAAVPAPTTWSISSAYSINSYVSYNSSAYFSKMIIPATAAWNASNAYSANTYVTYSGAQYRSNATIAAASVWSASHGQYTAGQEVSYTNGGNTLRYRCTLTHSSSNSRRPTNTSYWTPVPPSSSSSWTATNPSNDTARWSSADPFTDLAHWTVATMNSNVTQNANINMPSVVVPDDLKNLASEGAYRVILQTKNLTGNHKFSIIEVAAFSTLHITGHTRVYLTGDQLLTADIINNHTLYSLFVWLDGNLIIDPGASLEIYADKKVYIDAGSSVGPNDITRSRDFIIYSTYNSTSFSDYGIEVNLGSEFTGIMYAPDANIHFLGTVFGVEIFGAVAGKNIYAQAGLTSSDAKLNIHQDESLSSFNPNGIPSSGGSGALTDWAEVQ
ncbi:MAG: hypothetical protein HQL25_01760 [Candidatus Omnitrophica bacterium]|nr:hypothetical protein [Candidatus Omnitrophota bacterium]